MPNRHQWDRDGLIAKCFYCGLTVPAWRVRKGGLPKCDDYRRYHQPKLDSIMTERAVCLTGVMPFISCFSCPGRFSTKKCDKLRVLGGYFEKIGKPPPRGIPILTPMI